MLFSPQRAAPKATAKTLNLGVVGALVFGLLTLVTSPIQSPSVNAAATVTLTAQKAIPVAGTRLAPTAKDLVLHIAVPLKPANQAALTSFLQQLYDPASGSYHHYMTSEQFTAQFINSDVRSQVIKFLLEKNLTVTDSGLGSIVTASGTVAQVETAFNISISNYQAADGRIFYANAVTPALPVTFANQIQGVLGLNSFFRIRPQVLPSSPSSSRSGVAPRSAQGCSSAVNAASSYNAYTPNQFATVYDFDTLYGGSYQGQGQTMALVEFDDYSDASAVAWQTCFGSNVPVQRVPVDGGAVRGQIPSGELEVELDLDVVTGLAPGLAKVLVYEGSSITVNGQPNVADAVVLDLYQKIANDNQAKIVSSSWGGCELNNTSTLLNGETTIFQQMAAQGQSVFAASGDNGVSDCNGDGTGNNYAVAAVDDPASQPYVTGVGGTSLNLNVSNARTSETVWGGSGGGLSSIWPKPDYQLMSAAITNTYSNGKRQVPDVSADASPGTGYVVNYNGSWTSVGGTSAAAPLWAAGAAITNQYLLAHGHSILGFANGAIYTIFNYAPASFYDITAGNNCAGPACGSAVPSGTYPATAGYDQASGVGTLKLGAFAAAINSTTITYTVTPPVTTTTTPAATTTTPAVTTTTPIVTTTTPPVVSGTTYTYYLPFLANAAPSAGQPGSFTTFLAFENISSTTATIHLQYFDSQGNPLGSDSSSCPTLVAFAECIPSNPFAVGNKGAGVLTSSQPLNVIVAEATPYGGSAYAVSAGSSSSLTAPLAINQALGGFVTQLTIFNAGSSAAIVTVNFYDQQGNLIPAASKQLTIAAYATQTLDQTANDSGLVTGFYGWAQINGNPGSQLVAQILEQKPATHFVAIANAQATVQNTLYAPAIFNGAFGAFVTGANIVNPNPTAVTATVTYYANDGTALTTSPFSIAAHAVQAVYHGAGGGAGLPQMGLPVRFYGSAVISSSNGGLVMVVNESGGLSPSGAAQSGTYAAVGGNYASDKIGLPVMANGGFGFTTGVTLVNSSDTPITGTLQYYTVAGTPQGSAQSFNIGSHASQAIFQGNAGLPADFYGSAVITRNINPGSNFSNLFVTTNAQSASFFYTYTEPN